MASKEYGVDLDALDQVVKELNQVLKDMGGPKDKAKNQTYLPDGALGKGFEERDRMHKAHNDMKAYIEQNIVGLIEKMIDDFGKKSKQTKDAYDDAEHDNSMK
ncbi:hypothetical protein HEK616_53460 [Streptomyces nigrescens]|uniref:Uncharacterized protein n=1 Tax=Streptomyces nigrescens TaxID=1920 RepID=A0ABM7ZZQ8_STRNI|nr:hypothetical protein [Streptomyces nigrescens]BDM71859.1 hypothetical protein HEK616_53460 [Streptomyces nigrescens]